MNADNKVERYNQFMNVVSGVNYLNKKKIISEFNKSVRAYRRFVEVLRAGDEELAAEKLHTASTALYFCCEWSLKNYLHEIYSSSGEDCLENKLNTLNHRSTNIKKLLDELEEVGEPSIVDLCIDTKAILDNAKDVNNGPKHIGIVPSPDKYIISLKEIRSIIKNYVENSAELDFIDESIYGNSNVWYEILDDTSDFNTEYTYVLLTQRLVSNNVEGLFSLKWDLVIDMDPDSDRDGLADSYKKGTCISPQVRMLDSIDSKKKFSYITPPYWVMANGTFDDPESMAVSDKWGTVHGRYLVRLLEEFHREYSKPVKAFVYMGENERNLRKIIEYFNDIYDGGEDINFWVLSADGEYASIEQDNFRISSLTIEKFADNLKKFFGDKGNDFNRLKKALPTGDGGIVDLEDSLVVDLDDSFETVYIDIDKADESDAEKCNKLAFYKGIHNISWYGIRENFDVKQPEQLKITTKIHHDILDRGRLLNKVYYVPGIGGTTLMRRLAWEFRTICPTFILNRYNEYTSKKLQKIYNITHSPILIFADNNIVEFEEVKTLQIELKHMGFAFVICYFQRKLSAIKDDNSGSVYAIVREFGTSEAELVRRNLRGLLDDDDARHKFDERIKENANAERINSPFILSMFAFDKDFKGIKPYIANFLSGMNEQSKKILFALSLADYGNVSINMQYFINLFNDKTVDEFLLRESRGINELVRVEKNSGKNLIRIKYHLFGEEILRQMSNGRDASSISFLNLVDNILMFIDDSRHSSVNIEQDSLNLLRSLFVTRKADVNTDKPAFSTLIMKLIEEHKTTFDDGYDASTDAIVRIFNKLVDVYPEEAHFTAHLARFYFYIDKNYDKGFYHIDKAIELYVNDTGHVDPLLFHMKAMGYSSRITNIYMKELVRSIKDNPDYNTLPLREKVQDDAESAFNYFKQVRESNIGVAGHVSEINLCMQVVHFAQRMIEEKYDFTSYVSSEEGKWVLQYIDRAETMWEECKQLASDSIYEDLDGIEERLHSLTSSVEDKINIWNNYVVNANENGKNCAQARRILARAYLKAAEEPKNREYKKEYYSKVVRLMEANIAEENDHVGNIRIWFDSIKRIEVDDQDHLLQDAVIKLNRWVALTDSVEAHYYRFMLKFIQAAEGSMFAEGELPKLLRELKQKAASKYNRTYTQYWLTRSGTGINSIKTNIRRKHNSVSKDKIEDELLLLTGRVGNNYVNDTHAYIKWHGVDVYFNPSSTRGEISKANIGQRVKFCVGFSYDGPRAYNDSIKLLGKEDCVVEKREISSGAIVKCEVLKNVQYYVQVRIVGFSEEKGSIHINELLAPYSSSNRPITGQIIEGRVLSKNFDNAKQCDVWQITMDVDGAKNVDETAMAIAFKKAGWSNDNI